MFLSSWRQLHYIARNYFFLYIHAYFRAIQEMMQFFLLVTTQVHWTLCIFVHDVLLFIVFLSIGNPKTFASYEPNEPFSSFV